MRYVYLKMHQNAFGGRAPPGPAGGAYSAPQLPRWEGGGSAKEGKGGGRKGEGSPMSEVR